MEKISNVMNLNLKTCRLVSTLRQERRMISGTGSFDKKYVICGAGLQGAAVAYGLSELGLGKDTLIVDQGKIGGGTTKHAGGLVGVYKQTSVESRIVKDSLALYQRLNQDGHDIGWNKCGSLLLAQTRDRVTVFRRMKAASVARSIDCEWIPQEDLEKRFPYMNCSDLLAGLFIPEDGVVDPEKLCRTLVKLSIKNGVTVLENCAVSSVLSRHRKVVGLETSCGKINCDVVVNCAGLWARSLGKLSTPVVKVPVQACQHHHLYTVVTHMADERMPAIRDTDAALYMRVKDGGFLFGGFEPNAKPVFEDGTPPSNWDPKFLEPDWDYFMPTLEKALKRFPYLKDVCLEKLASAPEAFAPDGKWVLGQVPELDNYLVAAGMKTIGTSAAGGVGKLIAHWVAEGRTPYPLYELDVQRFLPLHNNRKFLLARAKEVPSAHYQIPYPYSEFRSGRKLRMSPLYARLRDAGAVFGQVMGFERPAWYEVEPQDSTDDEGVPKPFRVAYCNTFMKPPWLSMVRDEYWACREGVTISNYSSFTKLDLMSSETQVVDLLQYLCSNDVDIPIGGVIHTGMQNERGGYENDLSLARINDNHYMMIAPTVQQTKCLAWLRRHLPKDGSVSVTDVTSAYTAICLMGPMSRSLLVELSDSDMSPRAFPFFTCQEIDIGHASGVRAMNLTHVGELGWVLYIPNEYALHVYDRLVEHGKKYGIRHCGWFATRTLRIERFYAFWGQDLDTNTTPLECGRAFRVKFNSDIDFLGREALMRQRETGLRRMYVQLLLEDHDMELDPWPWGGEPVYRNGKHVGMTTTAGYGFTLGRQVCLGFLTKEDRITPDWVTSGHYEIDIAGIKFAAAVSLRSPTLPSRYKDPSLGAGERYAATRNTDVSK